MLLPGLPENDNPLTGATQPGLFNGLLCPQDDAPNKAVSSGVVAPIRSMKNTTMQ
jgi:hypothetical protein